MAWQTGIASVALLAGTQIQGLLILTSPSYVYERWHGTLLCIGVVLIAVIFNTALVARLPLIKTVMLLLHLVGFVVIVVPL